jgi:hypothetical protein
MQEPEAMARRVVGRSLAAIAVVTMFVSGCTGVPGLNTAQDSTGAATSGSAQAAPKPPAGATAPVQTAAAAAPSTPPTVLPFEEAVLNAANNLLGKAQIATAPPRHVVIIDPLIDGMTGAQSQATRAMGARIVALIAKNYPQYEVQPFTAANVARSPLVLVGTFTGVNKERKTEGQREAFRICLALADLKTGKLVSKGLAFSSPDGVDITPLKYFNDAPAWTEDPATLGYIRTCQGTKAGDAINPIYADRILAASMINEGMEAYNAGRDADALALFETVLRAPAGNQLRAYTGLYLTNWRLGRRDAAVKAFGQIVDQGLDSKRLGVKFLFRPGSAAFATDPKPGAVPYPIWISGIATQAGKRQSCLDIVGHTTATGPEPLNERLSLRRAEYVKNQIEHSAPSLSKRLITEGVGSRESMVGNGKDDASDALDRRVEFKVVDC